MTNREAYEFQLNRLTPEQKIQVNVKEKNLGRSLMSSEIAQIFKLEPYTEIRQPRKRRMSDEIESNNWMNQ